MRIRLPFSKIIAKTTIVLFGTMLNMNAQQVSYSTIYDDPHDVPNFIVSLDPFFAEVGSMGDVATLGFVLQANYNMNKRLAFEGSFAKAYLDVNADQYKPVEGNTKVLYKHKLIEGGAVFFFSDKEKQKNVKVGLSGDSHTSTFISVPATVFCQRGLRGGIFYYNYALHADDKKMYWMGKNPNTGNMDSLTNVSTNMNVTGIYGGLVFRKTTNLLLSVQGYGNKGDRRISEFYIDGFFAPVVLLSDISYQAKYFDNATASFQPFGPRLDYNMSSNPGSHFGWRIGWQTMIAKTIGYSFKFELGQKPGMAAYSNFYLNFNFGMTIGGKIKFKKKL